MSEQTPSPIKPILVIGSLALIGGGIWWMQSPPSASNIIASMQIKDKSIVYKGETYNAEWESEPLTFEGDARFIDTQFNKYAPFNTHVLILTTGDYSNPTYVGFRNGKVYIEPAAMKKKGKLEGDIQVLHLVPPTEKLFKKLERLETGKKVKVMGRIETDGKITDSKGQYIQFGNTEKGRILLMLDSLEVLS